MDRRVKITLTLGELLELGEGHTFLEVLRAIDKEYIIVEADDTTSVLGLRDRRALKENGARISVVR